MGVDHIVREAIATVPQAVAAGVIDVTSGLLLGVNTVETHPQEVLNFLAPATRELFESEMVTRIGGMLRKNRPSDDPEPYFKEILISSDQLWHYFGRLKSSPSSILAVVTRSDVNFGLFLIKCRELTANATI